MKKFIFVLLALAILAVPAYAVVRGKVAAGTADGALTSSDTILVDANIYYKGVTVGDKLELRKANSTGAAIFTVIADTANGSKMFNPAEPVMIDGGIYLDVTLTTGTTGVGANIIYQ